MHQVALGVDVSSQEKFKMALKAAGDLFEEESETTLTFCRFCKRTCRYKSFDIEQHERKLNPPCITGAGMPSKRGDLKAPKQQRLRPT